MSVYAWTKGFDFMDNTPRYTFEGRDPAYTYERFRVVIYVERVEPYRGFPKERRYFASVYDQDREGEWMDNPDTGFKHLKDVKQAVIQTYEYMISHPDTVNFRTGLTIS